MAQNLEGVGDDSAWMVVFACTSVSQALHTSAGSLTASLIDSHLTRLGTIFRCRESPRR
ncbi:hypothetical protein M405DRAFT_808970 [Rhizopogon salebrosus TDB-379]|nr:hypothetical protein M405DRAFT_808970 [Rhizopogon salebrosus TDB-379]